MSEIYFTSDHHFYHRSIIEYTNRPWHDVEQMNQGLIEAWNEHVTMQDTVYYLGDFCWRDAKAASEILGQLNGKIHLIPGNHDKRIIRSPLVQGPSKFASINPILELNINRQHIVLCHYAMLVWNKRHHGAWMLHGHSHGSLAIDWNAKRMDVGVDSLDYLINKPMPEIMMQEILKNKPWDFKSEYRPIHYEEVKKVMETRGFEALDHHGQ